VFDEEEHHAASQEEEDVLGERVGRDGVPESVDDRSGDEQHEGRSNRVARVETGPDRVAHVGDEQGQEHLDVRERHAMPLEDEPLADQNPIPGSMRPVVESNRVRFPGDGRITALPPRQVYIDRAA